jgi:hypothetical protein
MRILLRAVAISLCVALAIAASGEEPDIAKRWVATLNDSAALLRDGSYETARRQLGNLLDDMVERIGPQGRAVEPYVLKTLGASVTYAALDALRQWRYEPLPPDDPLKDVPCCTTFNFKLVK